MGMTLVVCPCARSLAAYTWKTGTFEQKLMLVSQYHFERSFPSQSYHKLQVVWPSIISH